MNEKEILKKFIDKCEKISLNPLKNLNLIDFKINEIKQDNITNYDFRFNIVNGFSSLEFRKVKEVMEYILNKECKYPFFSSYGDNSKVWLSFGFDKNEVE
jgi:hypothetical protein